jgi:hypothetical protein
MNRRFRKIAAVLKRDFDFSFDKLSFLTEEDVRNDLFKKYRTDHTGSLRERLFGTLRFTIGSVWKN